VSNESSDILDLVPKHTRTRRARRGQREEDVTTTTKVGERKEREDSLHHGRPLQRQTPTEDSDVGRDTHGLEHLRTEHSRVSDLDGLVELGVVLEDLERGLENEEERRDRQDDDIGGTRRRTTSQTSV